ncbi:hypothetical protein VFPBJ_11291 [Purpureocillium lilacinum]|uniref:Uncharacterized protein n=1 Tax=Purpureocillium lilacinum TaxID=33203 RepID=A0A179FEC3_PURLI|nr:hypothetical protein VFPBJ_11291 [Purpureocillium lilacinum]
MDLPVSPEKVAELENFSHSHFMEQLEHCERSAIWTPVGTNGLVQARKPSDVDNRVVSIILKVPSLQLWAKENDLKLRLETITARNPVWAKAGARVTPASGTISLVIPYPTLNHGAKVSFEPVPGIQPEVVNWEASETLPHGSFGWQSPKFLPGGSVLAVTEGEIKFRHIEIQYTPSNSTSAPQGPNENSHEAEASGGDHT